MLILVSINIISMLLEQMRSVYLCILVIIKRILGKGQTDNGLDNTMLTAGKK